MPLTTSDQPAGADGGTQIARWLPIETAPTDRPVVVRQRTDRLQGGWFVATVTLPDPEDESRFAGSSTIWHYNGDILMGRFRGTWTHWLCEDPAALASTARAGAGDCSAQMIEALKIAEAVQTLGYTQKAMRNLQEQGIEPPADCWWSSAAIANYVKNARRSPLKAAETSRQSPAVPASPIEMGEEAQGTDQTEPHDPLKAVVWQALQPFRDELAQTGGVTFMGLRNAVVAAVRSLAAPAEHGVEIRELFAQVIHDHTHREQGLVCWAEIKKLPHGPGYSERRAYGLADKLLAVLSPHQGPEPGGQGAGRDGEGRDLERVRHVKRSTEYEVLGEAEAQISGPPPEDEPPSRLAFEGDRLTVYRCLKTGKLWCRFTDEFQDGRFVPSPTDAKTGEV